jgi:hypothetical protein
LFVDPGNPGIVISEGFYTTEFMLVNRKLDLPFAPMKSMLLSIFGEGAEHGNGILNKDW